MKIAVCGDVHWSTYSSIIRRRGDKYSQRLEGLIRSLNWFEKLSKDNGCEMEIFLGDTFDKPDLSAEEMTALQDIKWNSIHKNFIVGNHESNINTLEYSSTKFFESIDANVISEYKRINLNDSIDFHLIPYIRTDSIVTMDKYDFDKNKKNIVFAHQDLAGLSYGRFTSTTGFSIEDILNSCTLFFDGHLHNEQIINDKIFLVGILTGQNFNEDSFKYEHLVYILNIEDDSISVESFINPEAFNFYKITISDKKDIKVFNKLKNNAVVSIICEESLIPEVNESLKKSKKIIESRLTVSYNYSSSSENDTQTILVDDYTNQFISLAKEKLTNSPILDSELARLGGN